MSLKVARKSKVADKMSFMMSIQRVGVVVGLMAATAMAQQKPEHKSSHKSASIQFNVVSEAAGKPVKNAEVILHPLDKEGRQKQEGLELKTHEDGKAEVDGIPFGKVRIQVIAHGFRTYGADYDLNQPAHEITIKLQRPTDQYSIYK
jgi:hypothetical protein